MDTRVFLFVTAVMYPIAILLRCQPVCFGWQRSLFLFITYWMV